MSLLLNGEPVDCVLYPNNETLLRPTEPSGDRTITLKYQDDGDLFRLQILVRHIRDNWANRSAELRLFVPYMPYSRADRSQDGSVFTLELVCELINDMRFDEVVVVEPHSKVTPMLLNNCTVIDGAPLLLPRVQRDLNWQPHDFVVLPDQGAANRYGALAGHNALVATKVRDFNTGRIQSVKFPDDFVKPMRGATALIVDDLCSYGGTFVLAAKHLREMGFGRVCLLVTHLETAAYNDTLAKELDHVYATDSIARPTPFFKYTIYPLEELL